MITIYCKLPNWKATLKIIYWVIIIRIKYFYFYSQKVAQLRAGLNINGSMQRNCVSNLCCNFVSVCIITIWCSMKNHQPNLIYLKGAKIFAILDLFLHGRISIFKRKVLIVFLLFLLKVGSVVNQYVSIIIDNQTLRQYMYMQ